MVTLFLNGQQQQQQITHGYLISKWSTTKTNITWLPEQQQQQITRGYLISKWSTTKTNIMWLPYF